MALNFPAPDQSPWTAPTGVVYTWNADGYWSAQAPGGGASDLQAVTDEGNTTTNEIQIRRDASGTSRGLLFENFQDDTGAATGTGMEFWLNNSNSDNTGASIGVEENGFDGYADIVFKTTGVGTGTTLQERMRILADGNLSIPSGGGIQFNHAENTSQGASRVASTMYQYEYGTFTPTVSVTNGGAATLSNINCTYVKVGKFVSCQWNIGITLTAAANTYINSNAPFAPAAGSNLTALPRVDGQGPSWATDGAYPGLRTWITRNSSMLSGSPGLLLGFADTAYFPLNQLVTMTFTLNYRSA